MNKKVYIKSALKNGLGVLLLLAPLCFATSTVRLSASISAFVRGIGYHYYRTPLALYFENPNTYTLSNVIQAFQFEVPRPGSSDYVRFMREQEEGRQDVSIETFLQRADNPSTTEEAFQTAVHLEVLRRALETNNLLSEGQSSLLGYISESAMNHVPREVYQRFEAETQAFLKKSDPFLSDAGARTSVHVDSPARRHSSGLRPHSSVLEKKTPKSRQELIGDVKQEIHDIWSRLAGFPRYLSKILRYDEIYHHHDTQSVEDIQSYIAQQLHFFDVRLKSGLEEEEEERIVRATISSFSELLETLPARLVAIEKGAVETETDTGKISREGALSIALASLPQHAAGELKPSEAIRMSPKEAELRLGMPRLSINQLESGAKVWVVSFRGPVRMPSPRPGLPKSVWNGGTTIVIDDRSGRIRARAFYKNGADKILRPVRQGLNDSIRDLSRWIQNNPEAPFFGVAALAIGGFIHSMITNSIWSGILGVGLLAFYGIYLIKEMVREDEESHRLD